MFLFRPRGMWFRGEKKHYTVQGWDIYDLKCRQTEGQVQALKANFLCCAGSANKGQLVFNIVTQLCNELSTNMALCLLFTEAVHKDRCPLSYKEAHPMSAVLFCPLSWTVMLLNIRGINRLKISICSVLANVLPLWQLTSSCERGIYVWKVVFSGLPRKVM